jgi:hypothetical protein
MYGVFPYQLTCRAAAAVYRHYPSSDEELVRAAANATDNKASAASRNAASTLGRILSSASASFRGQ